MRPISTKTHTIIGLVVGVVLIIAPWIFGFNDVAAAMLSAVLVGVFIILNELITTSPYGLVKLVPMRVHLALDVVTGLFLALSPWLFGFSGAAANVWVPHLIVGIMTIGYALMTSTADDTAPASAKA